MYCWRFFYDSEKILWLDLSCFHYIHIKVCKVFFNHLFQSKQYHAFFVMNFSQIASGYWNYLQSQPQIQQLGRLGVIAFGGVICALVTRNIIKWLLFAIGAILLTKYCGVISFDWLDEYTNSFTSVMQNQHFEFIKQWIQENYHFLNAFLGGYSIGLSFA